MKMMNQVTNAETTDSAWKSLYSVGGTAALIAAVIFRRNLGAEISLFSKHVPPGTVIDWFTLIQNNRLLGLSYLNLFDIADYVLVGLMFLALNIALRRTNRSYMAIATTLGPGGIALAFASNTALSMLSLSNQYAAATTDAQRAMFLAAGQAMLTTNGTIYQSTGIYMSFLLMAIAGLIVSIVILRSSIFSRVTAYVGILASAFDLTYCITLAFIPAIDADLIALWTQPAAGLLLMVWHILIGLRLLRLGSGVLIE